MTQHQGAAINRHVEALATGALLYSDTSHISLSSDARLLENWRTKIDRPSSHPPRIPYLLWQSSGDTQGETCLAECWESDRFSGALFPTIVCHSQEKALRKYFESAFIVLNPFLKSQVGKCWRPQSLHLWHPGVVGGWWLLSLATTPLELCQPSDGMQRGHRSWEQFLCNIDDHRSR